jgi:hypothetical protein
MRILPVFFILATLLIIGCSSVAENPQIAAIPGVNVNNHTSWGTFDITLDPGNLTIESHQVRELSGHFNVTGYFPSGTAYELLITGYNPATRIFDIKMRLRNTTPLTGYDVKAIISNYDLKEMINPDGWCNFHSTGGIYNPYYVFARDNADNAMTPGAWYERDFQVYVPSGATYNARITIDASYPASQEEIWGIDNVIISGPLQNDNYHYIAFTVHVRDHQGNIEGIAADLSPIGGPSLILMGDDALHKDYLAGDDIYGISEIMTSAPAGKYDIWLTAKSRNSTVYTKQKIQIEVIDPVTEIIPLYIVSMMHAEEQTQFLSQSYYMPYAIHLRQLKQVFDNHGAKIALQPDWTFIQGTVNFDPTLFSNFQASGHGVDTHAHESINNLSAVHDMLDDAGVTGTIVANGGFTQTWEGGNWAAYVAHFTDDTGKQMFLVSNAYKNPSTQEVDSLFTPIRPSTSGDWMVHDPDGPIVYIPGCDRKIESGPNFFNDLPAAIDDALRGIVPGKINTFYWHDSVHGYGDAPIVPQLIANWDSLLTSYFDPKVESGELVWKNFGEMYEIYKEWEE